ncbi:MAG: hypothetical protein R3B13_22345 [Polyangiaceae bacterium]
MTFALTRMLPELPREQSVVVELGRDSTVTRVEVELTREGETEPRRGFSLAVEPGQARVRHSVDLPHGRYTLRARGSGKNLAATEVTRRVTLDGNEIRVTIPMPP